MPIRQSDLNNASSSRSMRGHVYKRLGQPTAFLSHSHKDAKLALGLQEMLKQQGWDIYIDWQDQTMPDTPDAETAVRIKNAIVGADWFLFLATENSMSSRWCPWEIGYADGKKQLNRIAIVPTIDSYGRYHGNEYLKLYNTIDTPSAGGLALYDLQGKGYWVRNL
ncbi:toll/interleukin-1 receptor domain-containing protein [Pseudomonas alliivorans]|nr:toll/interleukin-1 receptor domain-containing protein [Pseudomonas alliivorans]MEE4787927.1 toll/interleukin-1 receptor domain-containing protein [Pseudomonas alliivorans]MEE4793203.1 toll/interleukin-1 receptor domain-containing protein [Pseudomonas alliivorans]MEE4799436.1 toll/interleukin-1 receptor domain-containing protein [Pseudomonas alliivorans]MEE4809216.1 toll/interleukin-1 receptor domain-containing protein [Pseudomonas alliivorans]